MITPIERVGDIWLKRDDLWRGQAPAQGAKARTASAVCENAKVLGYREINSCHDRNSSVPGMLSRVCKHYGLVLRLWIPASSEPLPPVFVEAKSNGAILEEIRPGYMSVRMKRMTDHAEANKKVIALGLGLDWRNCGKLETFEQTADVVCQAVFLPIKRVVVPVGSGVMFRAITYGIWRNLPILGVCCGSPPRGSFDSNVTLVRSRHDFHDEVNAVIGGVKLDPVYEAKCLEHLQPGDLLWIVAHRATQ